MATKKTIKESLEKQLASQGANLAHFEDLITDYLTLFDVKNKLSADIKTRGVYFKDVSSVGIPMMKNNPSVKELVMVNRQMLSLLKELGLTTAAATADDDEDDEM